MHIELIELLRCTNSHEDAHLVAVFHRVENRDVIDATLGCPVCSATYPLRNGVALFGSSQKSSREPHIRRETADDVAVSLAAFLDLTSPGLTVALAETWGQSFEELTVLARPRILGLTRRAEVNDPAGAAWLQVDVAIPLASNSLDGIALDGDFADPGLLSEAHRVLRPGRRLVAPASATLSDGFRELARDDTHVVAERMPELVRLSR